MVRGESLQIAKFKALIALGGNLDSTFGSARATLDLSLKSLVSNVGPVLQVSRVYQTPCFPAGAGPDYVNAVVEIETQLDAPELLARLHDIEQKFERRRDERWAGRTLDMDILSFEDQVLPDIETYEAWRNLPFERQLKEAPSELILPHPRLQDRGFVLIPLCDIRPDWRHPVLGQTARELCDALPEEQILGIKPI